MTDATNPVNAEYAKKVLSSVKHHLVIHIQRMLTADGGGPERSAFVEFLKRRIERYDMEETIAWIQTLLTPGTIVPSVGNILDDHPEFRQKIQRELSRLQGLSRDLGMSREDPDTTGPDMPHLMKKTK